MFRCSGRALRLDSQASLALFRIVQEAIHNAVTHGGASRIDIELAADSDCLCLRIQDDGSGFEVGKTQSEGMGLRVMQYRARSIGADLKIGSRPREGTHIQCLVPRQSSRKIS